jgi:hypothetical protein
LSASFAFAFVTAVIRRIPLAMLACSQTVTPRQHERQPSAEWTHLLQNRKGLGIARLLQVGTSAELDRVRLPLGVFRVRQQRVDLLADADLRAQPTGSDPSGVDASEPRIAYHAHRVGVLLVEHGTQRANLLRSRKRRDGTVHLQVALDLRVDDPLHLQELLGSEWVVPAKVEAQALVVYVAALLVELALSLLLRVRASEQSLARDGDTIRHARA